jgi:polysaccharide pyruvyl transferase WcaK-like protein
LLRNFPLMPTTAENTRQSNLAVEKGLTLPAAAGIALLHHVGGGNLGDDATLDTVIRNIRSRKPDAEIAAFTVNPDDTRKRHCIRSYPIRRTPWVFGYIRTTPESKLKSTIKKLVRKHRVLLSLPTLVYKLLIQLPIEMCSEALFLLASRRIISSFGTLIISGGGQLTEWGGPWSFPFTVLKWVLIAKSAGVKCVFLNVGAGPLTTPLSKFFVTLALRNADYVSFRDKKSKKLVQQIGFKGNGTVFPDCVYSRDVSAVGAVARGNATKKIVGIAPMPYWGPRANPAERDPAIYQEFMGKFADFVSLLLRGSYSVNMFGTDIGIDPMAIEDVRKDLLARYNLTTPEYKPVETIDELLSMFSAVDYVVTCRFHGIIFAHLLNKPVLAISPHPKVADLMNDLGLSKYCIDIEAFDAALLAEKFACLVSEANMIKGAMMNTLVKYRSVLAKQFDEVLSA